MEDDSKPYVYQPSPFPPEIQLLFHQVFNQVTDESLSQHKDKIAAVFLTHKIVVNGDFLDQFPSLKVVGNCGVGYDSVDLSACKSRGIRVGNTPNVLNDTTADMGLALLLAVARRVVEGDKISRDPAVRHINFNWYGTQVSGMTAGVIGLGRIGLQVAKRLKGFDMEILYNGRSRKPVHIEQEANARFVANLHDMLSQSDYVVLVAPATAETYRMMGKAEFSAMKSTGIFVNISRGSLVDQEALVESLREGGIGGAGLDVTDPEPLPIGHPLLSFPNVIVTPHSGSATTHTRRKMFQLTIDNILSALRGDQTMPAEVSLD